MTVENFDKYMELARVLNYTWGTGSQLTTITDRTTRFTILDDKRIRGMVMMIVNFPNDPRVIREMREKYEADCLETLKSALKETADKFKEETGKSIKLTMDSESINTNVEFISNAQYIPVLRAYYRFGCLIDVS